MLSQVWHDLWIILFVVLVAIGVFSGHGLVIGFGVMGLLVLGISWLWNRVSLEEISYERRLSQRRAFIGEEITMTVTLTNRKPVPLARVRIEDEVPESIQIAEASVVPSAIPGAHTLSNSTSLGWYERASWEYKIRASHRGFYRIGPTRMESGDLFGLFRSHRSMPAQDFLLVYPRVVPLPELGLPPARPLGDAGGGLATFQDPSRPVGIREYQTGDPLKAVAWKATAKMQRLQVRTFEPSSTTTVILAVAVETTARYWEGYSSQNLERVTTAAASAASYATERQYSLGLFSNGTPVLVDRPLVIAPNRSPEQLTIVLEALATIHPIALGPMASQLAEHARRFPLGATIMLVAALIPPQLVEVIDSLNQKGNRVVTLYVGDEPCPQLPEGVAVHHLHDYLTGVEPSNASEPR